MSRMTSKGQVTIPKRMRDELGLQPGSEIEFVTNGNGDIVIRTKREPDPSRFDALIGDTFASAARVILLSFQFAGPNGTMR